MKRTLSILLSVVLVLGMIPATFAASQAHQTAADNLYQLGLVSGTGTDAQGKPIYELDRAPTRSEAITVLVKLLGKAEEAGRGGWKMPFTDVPGWAQNFVGYAYANGLTAGTSATTFGGDDLVTAAQYITFVLKALGYSANGDFQWDKAWELSDKLGITGGRYNANTTTFLRGDVFAISEAALKIRLKDSNQTLAEKLMAAGAFTKSQYDSVYASKPDNALTTEQISEKCAPAVFYLESYSINGELRGSGSGFFISADGLAVTNRHVVEHAYYLKVRTPDGKLYETVRILDSDIQNDLALLQVEGENFPYLEQGNSDELKQGQQVYAFGCPKGLENTMSQGIVSNPGRTVDGTEYVQISVPIDHGSSGGALVDEQGKVVGVTAGGFESTADLNVAVPINATHGLDRNSQKDLFLMNGEDGCYDGFKCVYDFGLFSGVDVIEYAERALGWIYVYDMADFHAINGKTMEDSYGTTLEFYFSTLEDNGLKVYETEEGVLYYNEEELVIVLPDYKNGIIGVLVEWMPVNYNEFPDVLDLGWLMDLDVEYAEKEEDGSIIYGYMWNEKFSLERTLEIVGQYVDHLVERDEFKMVENPVEGGYAWLLKNGEVTVLIVVGNDGALLVKAK